MQSFDDADAEIRKKVNDFAFNRLSSVVSNQLSTQFDKIILRKEEVDWEILVLNDKKFMLTLY